MGKHAGPAKNKKGAQPPPPQPEGMGKKRTPTSAFDPAAGKDVYEPEKIIGRRLSKGVTQFNVKWVGWADKDNTWEPIEHLAGCEDMIAEFMEREKTRIAQLEAAAQAKHAEKAAAAAKALADASASAAAARVAVEAAGNDLRRSPRKEAERATTVMVDSPAAPGGQHDLGSKRTAPVWAAFDTTGAPCGKACCKLWKDNLVENGVCGMSISIASGPTAMWNHVMYKHPEDYIRLKPPSEPLNLKVDPQSKMNVLPAAHRDAIHKAHARWLCKRKRALSLTEDKEYHDIWNIAMRGAYTPPDHKIIMSNVLLLSGEGKKKLFDVNTSLRARGMKPAMAGDIWSDRGVSLLGLCEYYMSDDWTIKELVLAATPFSERHTGEAIDEKTRSACVAAGLSHDVFSTVFFPVSDNAANMISGWSGFGRGPCCVHTAQLSVHVFLNHSAIKPMREKEHGIVAHFSHATGVDGLGALHKCQRECTLPEHHPVKDNDTRWSSGHDQMEFFRVQQRAVQLYDVNHARKAGNAYSQYQMGLEDWRINQESVAVLQPVADWTQHMQGTKYPTLPLVLPTVYDLINGMKPDAALTLDFPGVPAYDLEPSEMHQGVLSARTAMHGDWVLRWITNLPDETKRTYAIASLLHPCFKSYNFIDEYDFIPSSDKAWAVRELRTEWKMVWKPRPVQPEPLVADGAAGGSDDPMPAPHAAPAPPETDLPEPLLKKRKVSLTSLIGGKMKKEAVVTPTATLVDELDEYIAEADEKDFEINLLAWWHAKETKWPNLTKMVKQYLSAPASSAGVERVFSAAGKMHGDLAKSAKDTTLEHSLFAAFNTD